MEHCSARAPHGCPPRDPPLLECLLHAGAAERFAETEGYNPRESNVLRMLGYFSLIGLQRVHTLVGDYHGALKAIHPLNLFQVCTPCPP